MHTGVFMGVDANVQSLHYTLIVWNNAGVNAIVSGGKWLS
jgi:hypothetical protein